MGKARREAMANGFRNAVTAVFMMAFLLLITQNTDHRAEQSLQRSVARRRMEIADDMRSHVNIRYGIPRAMVELMDSHGLEGLSYKMLKLEDRNKEEAKIVYIHCFGDFKKRIEVFTRALAYADRTDRMLVVLWQKDSSFSEKFSELFEDDERFVSIDVDENYDGSKVVALDGSPHDWTIINTVVVWKGDTKLDLDSPFTLGKNVYLRGDQPIESIYASPKHARRLMFSLKEKPVATSAMDEIRAGVHYGPLSFVQVSARLHAEYFIPYDVLVGMPEADRALLLDELMGLEKSGVKTPRCLLLHVQFGLGNRLRSLGSALAFAESTKRVLIVIWERDLHFNATFSDFFINDVYESHSFHAKWPFKRGKDEAFKQTVTYNVMKKDDYPILENGQFILKDQPGNNIYLKTAYVIKTEFSDSDNPKHHHSPTSQKMRTLIPTNAVRKRVAKMQMHGLSKMIGVHIRSKSAEVEMPSVDPKREYTEKGKKALDFWRAITQVHVFIAEMRKRDEKAGKPNKYFVASDDMGAIRQLKRAFPGKIYYNPRQCDDRGISCLRNAVVDIVCLSRSEYILGSMWSSFSEASVRLGAKDIYLAGQDFNYVKPST